MRIARVRTAAGVRTGLISADHQQIQLLPDGGPTADEVIRGAADSRAIAEALARDVSPVALDTVQLLPPLGLFNRDILCVGWNYLDHFYESEGRREGQDPEKLPDRPTFFTKGPDTVVGPRDEIAFDERLSQQWDYEAELAIVIGRDGRSIRAGDAFDHIFGVCIANDVSQRDLQRAHGGQWLKGKSIDRTMPLGPWITTVDEVDPMALTISCELNGTVVQNASTSDMIFAVDRIIEELSGGMTLRAGDVILTGTPSGIGNARTPPVYLAAGDDLATKIDSLGELRNSVQAIDLVSMS